MANKMINGRLCTKDLYVDHHKINHRDHYVVTEVIKEISKFFGTLTGTRGPKYNFHGMDIALKEKKFHGVMIILWDLQLHQGT